ncbi:MAG: hypothetical protein ACI90V_007916 [Bacillariaceae sp.]|jgi:hypothetical protein
MNLSRDANDRNSGGDIKEEEAVSLVNNEQKFIFIISKCVDREEEI